MIEVRRLKNVVFFIQKVNDYFAFPTQYNFCSQN